VTAPHKPLDALRARELLAHLHRVAVEAAHGAKALIANAYVEGDVWRYGGSEPLAVPLPSRGSAGRVLVIGAGKAVAAMAQGMEAVLTDRIGDGIVVAKYGHREPLHRIRILEAAHPIPDAAGAAATQELLRLVDTSTRHDTIFCLLTGGASSLLVAPAPGVSLGDKVTTGALLVNSGASINEINVVRKHLSAIKGGRLRLRARCRAFCTLAISDVLGDDPSVIGSGPTVPDPSTSAEALQVIDRYGLRCAVPASVIDHLQQPNTIESASRLHGESSFRIIASIRTSIDACVREAEKLGLRVRVVADEMSGATHDAARSFASAMRAAAEDVRAGHPPTLLLAGGETTLAVKGNGRGGRNQEFALVVARELQNVARVAVLAAGTDGTDGPTDAAGAFVDGTLFARAHSIGVDPEESLRRNDAYPLLDALAALYKTGPTGTNVMDVVIGIAY
jgi:glycerate 2-kinase